MTVATLAFVRNLTAMRPGRRDFDASRRGALVLSGLLTCLVGSAAASVPEWHRIEDIAATAEIFLSSRAGNHAKRTSVEARLPDPRLKLTKCSEPLSAFLRPGTRIARTTVVGVRCEGAKPWKIYVPVDVAVFATVLVAKRSLPHGHILTDDDIMAEERNVARLNTGYLSNKHEVVGRRLKSQLIAGSVLTPRSLKIDLAVRRGQTVTIVARNSGIDIKMGGKAMMDGAVGQRIRVENNNSGRIVEAIVRSPEHVEVLLPENNRFLNAKPKVSP